MSECGYPKMYLNIGGLVTNDRYRYITYSLLRLFTALTLPSHKSLLERYLMP